MADARLSTRNDGPIGWLTFSNPARLNAMTFDMWSGVPAVMAEFEADPTIRVVVLRGDGDKAFVSGADISEFEQKRGTADAIAVYNAAGDAANAAIEACRKPTLAMLQGYCIGGGLGIALACDLRLAARNTRFAVPAAKLGLGYRYSGIKRLVDVVGPSFAKEIFYSARQFDIEEALAMGLVNRAVDTADLERAVSELAGRIAGNAPLTITAAKLAIDAAIADPGDADLDAVDRAVARCFDSEDYREGRRAFTEKRPPIFNAR